MSVWEDDGKTVWMDGNDATKTRVAEILCSESAGKKVE